MTRRTRISDAPVPTVIAFLLAGFVVSGLQAVPRAIPQEVPFKTAMNPDREMTAFLYVPRPAEPGTTGGTASPGPGSGPAPASNPFGPAPVLFFSGEWGWKPLLQDTASTIAAEGRAVLGIESNEYFSRTIDDQGLASDLRAFRARLNEAAGRAPDAPVIIAGFAYGAEMVPFVLNRAGSKGVNGLLLIAPNTEGATIYRVAIQLRMPSPPNEQFNVAKEMARLPALPVVLMQGTLDEYATAKDLAGFLRGPHLYVPIEGGDRQFHEARQPFFSQVLAAFRWFDQGAPALPGAASEQSGAAKPPASAPPAPATGPR